MKKLTLTLAVLMGVSAANLSNAANGLKIVEISAEATGLTVKAIDGLKFKLTLDNLSKKTYIAIKNNTGEVFHTEYVSKTEQFTKVFDLSNLPDGNYYFEVVTGKEKMVKPFQISTQVNRKASAN
jgi:flagellar hook assembly protein FlgD